MPYVVNESCIFCRSTSCTPVCPVDCFYADDRQLYIHPDECIDCGACEPECPSSAIYFEIESESPQVARNREHIVNARPAGGIVRTHRPFSERQHVAHRAAFLADLSRAAAAAGRESLVTLAESWIPAHPVPAHTPRPAGPGPALEAELLSVLEASFPDRWLDHVQHVRRLLGTAGPDEAA